MWGRDQILSFSTLPPGHLLRNYCFSHRFIMPSLLHLEDLIYMWISFHAEFSVTMKYLSIIILLFSCFNYFSFIVGLDYSIENLPFMFFLKALLDILRIFFSLWILKVIISRWSIFTKIALDFWVIGLMYRLILGRILYYWFFLLIFPMLLSGWSHYFHHEGLVCLLTYVFRSGILSLLLCRSVFRKLQCFSAEGKRGGKQASAEGHAGDTRWNLSKEGGCRAITVSESGRDDETRLPAYVWLQATSC